MRYKRALALSIHWQDEQLAFSNYLQQHCVSGHPLTVQVLDYFSDWRSLDEVVAHFTQYSPQSLRKTLAQLVAEQLLLEEGSAQATSDAMLAEQWAPWLPEGAFHFATKDTPFASAASSEEELAAIVPTSEPPALYRPPTGGEPINLPRAPYPEDAFHQTLLARRTHRAFSQQALALDELSRLLALVWGVQGHVDSAAFGRLPLKTSPSGGARHPVEVYVMALRVAGLAPGIYHYHPLHHTLSLVNPVATPAQASLYCADQEYFADSAALFLMTAVFERTMWKYHKPRAYRVVMLDAGHLGQTFCLTATAMGLAPWGTAALRDSLIEQDLGIDGISESVLFVTGVGHPAEAADATEPE